MRVVSNIIKKLAAYQNQIQQQTISEIAEVAIIQNIWNDERTN